MWHLLGQKLESRLLLGTARYPSLDVLREAVLKSQTEIITVSIRRQGNTSEGFCEYLKNLKVHLLPNTAGCRTAKEAILTAQMARELFDTPWIKLEVVGDEYLLQPDPIELVEAARELLAQGFQVFPYMSEDIAVAERLVQLGCKILMPWASPIGSGRGLRDPLALKAFRKRFKEQILVIDAGIGKPSHAAQAMELGFDAVLLNSAVALSTHPAQMASAFASALKAGRAGYEAGLIPEREFAEASTPLVGMPFWHGEKK